MRLTEKIYILCFIGVVFLAGCGAGRPSSSAGLQEPIQQAPEFRLPDLNGKEVSLSDYKGQVVLLDFSTTWCPYCISIIPELSSMDSDYSSKGLKVIAVYVNETADDVAKLVRRYSISYTTLIDGKGAVAAGYAVVGVPTVFLIDQDGMIRYKGQGVPMAAIEALLD